MKWREKADGGGLRYVVTVVVLCTRLVGHLGLSYMHKKDEADVKSGFSRCQITGVTDSPPTRLFSYT